MTAATRKGMLDLTPNAITVLERRYLVKDDHGAPVEGPEDLFWRGGRPRPPPHERDGGPSGADQAVAQAVFSVKGTPLWVPKRPPLIDAPPPRGPLSGDVA